MDQNTLQNLLYCVECKINVSADAFFFGHDCEE